MELGQERQPVGQPQPEQPVPLQPLLGHLQAHQQHRRARGRRDDVVVHRPAQVEELGVEGDQGRRPPGQGGVLPPHPPPQPVGQPDRHGPQQDVDPAGDHRRQVALPKGEPLRQAVPVLELVVHAHLPEPVAPEGVDGLLVLGRVGRGHPTAGEGAEQVVEGRVVALRADPLGPLDGQPVLDDQTADVAVVADLVGGLEEGVHHADRAGQEDEGQQDAGDGPGYGSFGKITAYRHRLELRDPSTQRLIATPR